MSGTFAPEAQTVARGMFFPVVKMTAAVGAFVISGQAAGLKRGLRLVASAGALTISGQAVQLTYSGGAAVTPVRRAAALTRAQRAQLLRLWSA